MASKQTSGFAPILILVVVLAAALAMAYFWYQKQAGQPFPFGGNYYKQIPDNKPSPIPTCRPRPACLDSTPRCLIAESLDMCPPASSACTMDVKLCPNGSYVARTGPSCEFAPCPSP